MDVHDSSLKGAEKISFQHTHKTGEDNQINLRGLQRDDEGAFGFLVQLGSKFSRRDELRGHFPLARMREDARRFDIAQHDADFRRDFPRRNRVGDGDEVRTFSGTENA